MSLDDILKMDLSPDKYCLVHNKIYELEQQCKKQKEVIDKLNFIKNRKNQGASQESINKMVIEFVKSWLKDTK